MNCNRCTPLLYLYRSGELTAAESKELSGHLAECSRCAEEYRRIAEAEVRLDRLRSVSPSLPDPQSLASEIVRRIRTDEASLRDRRSQRWWAPLVDAFDVFSVRAGFAGACAVLILLFSVEMLSITSGVSELERRLGLARLATLEPTFSYTIGIDRQMASLLTAFPTAPDFLRNADAGTSVSVRRADVIRMATFLNSAAAARFPSPGGLRAFEIARRIGDAWTAAVNARIVLVKKGA